MRITTWNVNGLRAALSKGFGDVLAQLAPDVLLLQEIRCHPEQLPEPWQQPIGWQVAWHPAERKGYAGTAIWSRLPMELLGKGLGDGYPDADGRVLAARIAGVFVASVYLPSGSSGEQHQASKERWMERFLPWAKKLAAGRQPVLLGGDLNIAHTERDIYYASSNAKTSGFLPHERAWFTRLLETGWMDLIRRDHGDVDGPYSWWSNRGNARALDRGWRIDYLLANEAAAGRCRQGSIYRLGGQLVSDHAPVTVQLDGA